MLFGRHPTDIRWSRFTSAQRWRKPAESTARKYEHKIDNKSVFGFLKLNCETVSFDSRDGTKSGRFAYCYVGWHRDAARICCRADSSKPAELWMDRQTDRQTDRRTLDSFVDPATHSLLREQSWEIRPTASVSASNVSWCKFYETRDTVCMFVVLLR